jgi:hypothetical protein
LPWLYPDKYNAEPDRCSASDCAQWPLIFGKFMDSQRFNRIRPIGTFPAKRVRLCGSVQHEHIHRFISVHRGRYPSAVAGGPETFKFQIPLRRGNQLQVGLANLSKLAEAGQ